MNWRRCVCLAFQLCPTVCDPMNCDPPGSSVHGDSAGKNTGVDCHALLQGIFPTQGLNPGLPYCRQILYRLKHQGSPRILEQPTPSPGDLPDPGIKLRSPALQVDSLLAEPPGKPWRRCRSTSTQSIIRGLQNHIGENCIRHGDGKARNYFLSLDLKNKKNLAM